MGSAKLTVTNPATTINGPQYGNGSIQAAASDASVINAYGYSNTITDQGWNDLVNAGQGQATVCVNTGSVTVALNGYNNVVQGFNKPGSAAAAGANGNNTVSGSQGNTTVTLSNGQDAVNLGGYNNVITLGSGNDVVVTGQGNATVALGDGSDQVTLGGYGNAVTAGNGNTQVSGAQGTTMVTLGNGNNTVSLAGNTNVIKVGDGTNSIVAGTGSDQVMAGRSNNTITLAGWSNTVTLGGGTDMVNGGSGDSITVNSTTLSLQGGTQETIFLGTGPSSIDDLSKTTTVISSPASGSAKILDFAKDIGFVLDLKGGAGGFTSTAGIVSALQSDGHGETQLLLGSGSGLTTIDFVNTSMSALTSAHFRIG